MKALNSAPVESSNTGDGDTQPSVRPQILPLVAVGPLVFASGLCALVYQVVWLRELRLVFGCSTAATSAVLAIFMGGVGLGGALLGRWADRRTRPIVFYAQLELMAAALAALSPFLLVLARQVYVYFGGTSSMGIGVGTLVRLLLAALVLGLPTFLMGGALPAAARGVVAPGDGERKALGWLYGLNTLGAVAGAMLATFLMLEIFGMRNTLWLACFLNALVGAAALAAARWPRVSLSSRALAAEPSGTQNGNPGVPRALVFAVAALTGFVFFIMELVWYRTLGPLLGGSTYTFGLILSVALAGIGAGGALYSVLLRPRRVSLGMLAWTIGIEALFLAFPYALGDRLAILAGSLTLLSDFGLTGKALGWAVVAGIVIFPAALVSGFQFPLLIALLGRGGRNLGADIGYGYAWNTAGAIAGSLAGGFGFLPLFTALGVWRGSAAVLVLLCFALVLVARKTQTFRMGNALALVPALAAAVLVASTGPTAAWRHSPITTGRIEIASKDRNEVRDWLNDYRRNLLWEAEGVEASLALLRKNSLSFVLNGRIDGNAVLDGTTQVMLGMVSAALHPSPERSLVIGLGTGSSAGWLAQVPSMERVEVVELEPAMLAAAKPCGPVNRLVLDNPKVSVSIADAREFLLTAKARYDLIVSAPSNPFRAGIASLYTREFYEAARRRMAPGGYFTQWVQAYEVDRQTIDTIYATLAQVFPYVETWQTNDNDLIFICSTREAAVPSESLRRRLSEEPFRSALAAVWGAVDLEGFAARFIAGPGFARQVANRTGHLNTDDLMLVEFGYARTVGHATAFDAGDLRKEAVGLEFGVPAWSGAPLDKGRMARNRMALYALEGRTLPDHELAGLSPSLVSLAGAYERYLAGDFAGALAALRRSGVEPHYPLELAVAAESLAVQGDRAAAEYIERLAPHWPVEAPAIGALLAFRRGDLPSSRAALEETFTLLHTDPWVHLRLRIIQRSMRLAMELAARDPSFAKSLYALLGQPFVVRVLDELREVTRMEIGARIDLKHAVESIRQLEPHVLWNEKFLRYRSEKYGAFNDPLALRAQKDLERFLKDRNAGMYSLRFWF